MSSRLCSDGVFQKKEGRKGKREGREGGKGKREGKEITEEEEGVRRGRGRELGAGVQRREVGPGGTGL